MQDLLKELEEFAFRGIPDMRPYSSEDPIAREEMVCAQPCLFSRQMDCLLLTADIVVSASTVNNRLGSCQTLQISTKSGKNFLHRTNIYVVCTAASL